MCEPMPPRSARAASPQPAASPRAAAHRRILAVGRLHRGHRAAHRPPRRHRADRADPAAHARVLAAIAVGNYYDIDGTIRDRLSARAIELAEATGDNDVLADALLSRALTFAGVASRVHDEEDALKRLMVLPHRLSRLDEVLSHNMLTLTALILGRIDEMEDHLR